MSRVGRMLITLPSGVTLSADKDWIEATGPKGSLRQFAMPEINVAITEGQVAVSRNNDEASSRAKHGLMRALVNNLVIGVSVGFEKKLELNGVGYRVSSSGNELKFALGFSHEVVYKLPEQVTATIDGNVITISGISKQAVGQVAAEIRAKKKPEPYKGKGIKYLDERIIRKSGKSGKDK